MAKPGRPRLHTPMEPEVLINEIAVAEDFQALKAMAQLEAGYSSDMDAINQALGRSQAFMAIGSLTNAMNLQSLKSIKETKQYRVLKGRTSVDRYGQPIDNMGTWEGFCRALGMSVAKVDEDLINLDSFGEEALDRLSQLGAGYRDLRRYRKLPEDRKQALIEVAKVADKESFVELAEEIFAKHTKEKETLLKAVEDGRLDLAASEKRIGVLRQQREDAEAADARTAALSPEGRITKLQEAAADSMRMLSVSILHLRAAMLNLQDEDAHAAPFLAGLLKRVSLELSAIAQELCLPEVSDLSAGAMEFLRFQADEERSKTAPA